MAGSAFGGRPRRTRGPLRPNPPRPTPGGRSLQPRPARMKETPVAPSEEQPDWKSISWLPTMTEHLQGMLQASREQLDLLGPALAEPYRLDDATVERLKEAFQTQLADLWLWQEQVRQWREGEHGPLDADQKAGVAKAGELVEQIHTVDER